MKLADQYKILMAKLVFSVFRETISILIDKGEFTNSTANNAINQDKNLPELVSGLITQHRAIQEYWLGHGERCHYYVEKVSGWSKVEHLGTIIMMTFLHGLGVFQVLKKKSTAKLRLVARNVIATIKTAASHSQWNFSNKVRSC
jgi:hypothetical protein